jgi:hypothetical protein
LDGPLQCNAQAARTVQAAAAATVADAAKSAAPLRCIIALCAIRACGAQAEIWRLGVPASPEERTRGAVISSALFAVEWRLAIGGDIPAAAKASVPLRHRQHATSRMYRAAHDLQPVRRHHGCRRSFNQKTKRGNRMGPNTGRAVLPNAARAPVPSVMHRVAAGAVPSSRGRRSAVR